MNERPQSYRAIELQAFGESFREATAIVELPLRAPAANEIQVRNRWCGINGIFDTQIARNAVDYVSVGLPSIMGVEAAGVVEAVGEEVEVFEVGDAVATVRFNGGYREWNTADASRFATIPEPTAEWLALASTGVSAMLALEHVGAVQAGETVAVSAAAGGLGHLIVQLAKLHGCHVVGICGGPEKAAFVRSLGADRVIDYKREPVQKVLDVEYRNAIDLAIDTVSGPIYDAMLDNLAVHGRLVVGGAANDLKGRPEIVSAPRIASKLYYKAASVRGFMNGLLPELWPAARDRLFGLFREGKLDVTFDQERFVGLPRVYDAVDRLIGGQSMGKVVVDLRT